MVKKASELVQLKLNIESSVT